MRMLVLTPKFKRAFRKFVKLVGWVERSKTQRIFLSFVPQPNLHKKLFNVLVNISIN